MQSAPSAIADTSVMTLRPGFAAPARSPRSTVRSTSASIPSRSASTAGSSTPAFATDPLVIEHDPRAVRQTLHHAGDLLVQARRRPIRQLSACSGGHLNLSPGQHPTEQRWIQAKASHLTFRGVRAGLDWLEKRDPNARAATSAPVQPLRPVAPLHSHEAVDEAGDESFPASDPPAGWAGAPNS